MEQQEGGGGEAQQDHFFSGLANSNPKRILAKIISYLPGEDVRNCLWTCQALRRAVMSSDSHVLEREAIDAYERVWREGELKPRKVSRPFKADIFPGEKEFEYGYNDFEDDERWDQLAMLVNDTEDGQEENVLQGKLDRDHLKIYSEYSSFAQEELKRKMDLGFDPYMKWNFTPLHKGNLLMVERDEEQEDNMTECWLVRMDENGGRIIDKWDYLDIVDEDDDLLKENGFGELTNWGLGCRRGNRVFYVQGKQWLAPDDVESLERQRDVYIFAFVVDLDENKVLWKKRVGYDEDWETFDDVFISDKVCGYLVNTNKDSEYDDFEIKMLKQFDVETGAEIPPEEPPEMFLVDDAGKLTPGADVVAMTTRATMPHVTTEHRLLYFLSCHQLGTPVSAPRRYLLAIPKDQTHRTEKYIHYTRLNLVHENDKGPANVSKFALFANRFLVYSSNGEKQLNKDEYLPSACFIFWDLEGPVSEICGKDVPVDGEDGEIDYEEKEVDMIVGRVVWLDGFLSLAPNVTGNTWFLLSSESIPSKSKRKKRYTEDEVFHTLHAIDINKSLNALWKRSQGQNLPVK